jgi:hypothetical protein
VLLSRRRLFLLLLLLLLRQMMPGGATYRCAQDTMMAGHVTCDRTYRGTFDATLCLGVV